MQDITKFISGFKSFRNEYFCREDSPYTQLKARQKPSTLVIACSDSRTDPSLVMQCEPGEIFVVRNIANIVPPYEPDSGYHGVSSAIEYAVKELEIQNIIILGHSSCGGIKALMEQKEPFNTEFVDTWLSVVKEVRNQILDHFECVDEESCTACEMAGILHSMKNLETFPWIAERVKTGALHIHGWYFDMETGQLLSYLEQTGSFEPLTRPCPKAKL